MITNFDEYYNAIKASGFTMAPDNLSLAEQTTLKVLVSLASEEDLKPAIDVLADYYFIEIPRSLLIELLQSRLDLAMETFTRGISDTCQRELLIDALLQKIGYRRWPIYRDDEQYSQDFFAELPSYLKKVGGKVVGEWD